MSEPDEVGPLGEEAAKLLGALSGWARDHSEPASEWWTALASDVAETVGDLDEHLATGAAECTVCPLCRSIHAVRQISPEVTTHLASALTSLAEAAAALLSTPVPPASARDDDRPGEA